VDGKKRFTTLFVVVVLWPQRILSLPWTPYLPYSHPRRRRSSFILEYICCAGAALPLFSPEGCGGPPLLTCSKGLPWCWSLWV